ncbi:tetratricopeptide repeat protein [Methanococcoides alaskense]|uniref:Tetratricopeptide (TPR) repeat protein n=1 Tax=Methanococcoides alaskense TaxID=325778 RepID=A0AA90TXU3_9EURY|nr:tetratricopeptide repeat protein [Methanococcoides alaskense]MDA0525231.1 tetratricopeptide repeat protein [Methanococcoides alaskense]MDR6221846.1 tetratricopeptide (TPR) repeat protein [Methanococcoides alaskense]
MNFSKQCIIFILSILIFSSISYASVANEDMVYNNTTIHNSPTSAVDTGETIRSEDTMNDENYLLLANQNLDRSLNLLSSILDSIMLLLTFIGIIITALSGIALYIIRNYNNKFKNIKNEADVLLNDAKEKHAELSRILTSARDKFEDEVKDVGDITIEKHPSSETLEKVKKFDSLANLTEFLEMFGAKLNFDYYFNLSSSNYYKNEYEKSLKAINKALDLNPDDAEAWNNKGVTLGDLGRHEEALEAHNKALELNPDYADAWNNKGVVLGNLDRHEEALEAYKKALELNPDYADAWNNKGVALSYLGRHEEALEAYKKAIDLDPENAEAWNNKGVALRDLGRHEEALEAYKKALDLNPDDAEIWYNKAGIEAINNSISESLFDLKMAIKIDSKFRETAKTEDDFDNIKSNHDFVMLVHGK